MAERSGELTREMLLQLFLKAVLEGKREGFGGEPFTADAINNLKDLDREEFTSGVLSHLGPVNAAGVNIRSREDIVANKAVLDTGSGFAPENTELFMRPPGDFENIRGLSYFSTLMHEVIHSLSNQQGAESVASEFNRLVNRGQADEEALVPPLISRGGMSMEDFDILAGIVRLFEDAAGIVPEVETKDF